MIDGKFEHPSTRCHVIGQAVRITAAYSRNNFISAQDLPHLLKNVYAALAAPRNTIDSSTAQEAERPTPAQIRKSVSPEAIISFIDGKTYKMLKRHLGLHGLDPDSYRQRYGLPADYPMTAASHSARRSELARAKGLGRFGWRGKTGSGEVE